MRWKEGKEPEYHDIRIIKNFLWIPKTINGESRRLEKAVYLQEWLQTYGINHDDWVDIEWKN